MDPRSYLAGAVGAPPAVPSSPSIGYPTDGDPLAPLDATSPGAHYFYKLGEELRNIIVAAGLTPSDGNLTQLLTAIHSLIGAGKVSFFARTTPPTGYLKANGALVSRTTYAALFASIGTVFGVGDGSTTFALPDLRGEFLRGWDDGRGIDASRGLGTAQKGTVHSFDAGAAGAVVGDRTASTAVGGVGHGDLGLDNDASVAITYPNALQANTNTGAVFSSINNTAELGAGVMRPRNMALLACIKF